MYNKNKIKIIQKLINIRVFIHDFINKYFLNILFKDFKSLK